MKPYRIIILSAALLLVVMLSCRKETVKDVTAANYLKFNKLASTWDEAIPFGNGMLGALVWQKENNLRISLDRADLWDLRPMLMRIRLKTN